jgi:outer membrane biogenesis lipoprotein LolB
MRALILNFRETVTLTLLTSALFLVASCATDKKAPPLVDDPAAKHDSAIPWNEQQKWEQGSAIGALFGRNAVLNPKTPGDYRVFWHDYDAVADEIVFRVEV